MEVLSRKRARTTFPCLERVSGIILSWLSC